MSDAGRGWRGLALVCPSCRSPLSGAASGAACSCCGRCYPEGGGVLHLVTGSIGAPAYDPSVLATLREVEDRHFWFVGRRQVILNALRRAVPDLGSRALFDIGCGSGGLLAFLARSGVPIAGACDAHVESLRLVGQRLDVPLVLVDEGRLPPLGAGHELLAMFDVLEHMDDDAGVLRALHDALAPGGSLVLTVPADPELFDEIDELAGHRRRYTREGLRGVLEEAGLRVQLLAYFMSALAVAMAAGRPAERLRWRSRPLDRRAAELRIVPGVNGALRAVFALERAVTRIVSPGFGASLVAVASRPQR